VRAVLDPNVLISALLSRGGRPAQIVSRWLAGDFELVVSAALLAELRRALSYPKLRERVSKSEADEFVALLERGGLLVDDPAKPLRRCADPGDDYLVALAENANAMLVSGDQHVLELAGSLPIHAPVDFLRLLH
jgi:uncharacterized protein